MRSGSFFMLKWSTDCRLYRQSVDYTFSNRMTFQLSAGSFTCAWPPSTAPPGPAVGATFSGFSSVFTAFTSSWCRRMCSEIFMSPKARRSISRQKSSAMSRFTANTVTPPSSATVAVASITGTPS